MQYRKYKLMQFISVSEGILIAQGINCIISIVQNTHIPIKSHAFHVSRVGWHAANSTKIIDVFNLSESRVWWTWRNTLLIWLPWSCLILKVSLWEVLSSHTLSLWAFLQYRTKTGIIHTSYVLRRKTNHAGHTSLNFLNFILPWKSQEWTQARPTCLETASSMMLQSRNLPLVWCKEKRQAWNSCCCCTDSHLRQHSRAHSKLQQEWTLYCLSCFRLF